jgi:hypothetical protein
VPLDFWKERQKRTGVKLFKHNDQSSQIWQKQKQNNKPTHSRSWRNSTALTEEIHTTVHHNQTENRGKEKSQISLEK